jgi:hypothetical protein
MVLLFGGNDVSRHCSVEVHQSEYAQLMAQIRLINPNLGHNELVVSEILPRGNFSPAQEEARVLFYTHCVRHTFICKHTENNVASFNIFSSAVISVYHLFITGTRLNMVGVALSGRRTAPSA